MLWERKLQLEKELQEALDPNIGGDIVEAMKKEIHRMELRLSELMRQQEKLIQVRARRGAEWSGDLYTVCATMCERGLVDVGPYKHRSNNWSSDNRIFWVFLWM